MKKDDVLNQLGKKETKAEDIAGTVTENPSLLSEVLDGTSSTNPTIKFKAAKTLAIISRKSPRTLYPKMDFFINLLDSTNNILKWTAIDAVANLTTVDSENKFDAIFRKYYGFLADESMITVGHVIDNSGTIAKAKPHLTDKITGELLKTETIPVGPHLTTECKNILFGKAILAFGAYFDQIEKKDDVITFVKKQLHNTRNATKAKAEKFLKKSVHQI
jgi:hypothetical protein